MSVYATLAHIVQTITTQQCNVIYCWDATRTSAIFRREGTPEQIVEGLEATHREVSGTMFVEVFREKRERNNPTRAARGSRSRDEAKFEFLLRDQWSQPGMREVPDRSRKHDDRDESEVDDDDEDDEPEVDHTGRMLDLVEKWMPAVLSALSGKKAPRSRMAPVNGQPQNSRPADPSVSSTHRAEGVTREAVNGDEERAAMRNIAEAIRNMRERDPEAFATYSDLLLKNYGPGTDGKATSPND